MRRMRRRRRRRIFTYRTTSYTRGRNAFYLILMQLHIDEFCLPTPGITVYV
jgi:hypothetical protein